MFWSIYPYIQIVIVVYYADLPGRFYCASISSNEAIFIASGATGAPLLR